MKTPAILPPPPAGEGSSREAPQSLEAASRAFESLLMSELYKVMHKTVPKDGLFGGGFATDLFGEMLNEQLARHAADAGGLGLAKMLQGQLGKAEPMAIDPTIDALLREEGWVQPTPHRRLGRGQHFGAFRPGLRPATCGEGHCGVDLAAARGTTVVAAAAGIVRGVGRDPSSEAGQWVSVAHRDGRLLTRYLHLDSIRPELAVGVRVAAGEHLGEMGDSGTRAQGVHLHFELRTPEQILDPTPYLEGWDPPPQDSSDFADGEEVRPPDTLVPREAAAALKGPGERPKK